MAQSDFAKKIEIDELFFSCHAYNSYEYDINIDDKCIKMVLYMWR